LEFRRNGPSEKVTGLTYERAVTTLLFDPLGMAHSFFMRDDIRTRRFVAGHDRGDDPRLADLAGRSRRRLAARACGKPAQDPAIARLMNDAGRHRVASVNRHHERAGSGPAGGQAVTVQVTTRVCWMGPLVATIVSVKVPRGDAAAS
jgi:CubicO group peptidase (beta-lactamase class C family)